MTDNRNENDHLCKVLTAMLGQTAEVARCREEQLHGGTLGDVKLFSGSAKTADGTVQPFRAVQKKQKKWERDGDPDSWRREYDLAVSDFSSVFTDSLRWPDCYIAELHEKPSGEETEIWMEFIDGISGSDLTMRMLEQTAYELGVFQGRLYRQPEKLTSLTFLSDPGFPEREYAKWHKQTFDYQFLCSDQCRVPEHVRNMIRSNPWDNGKTIEYNYLRSAECGIPEHLKQMLTDIDENRTVIFEKMKRLPVVFCHRDLWIENIFWSDGTIVLIDWDGAGFGYLGEDIASLIADDTESDCIPEYYRKLIPAYYEGISKYLPLPAVTDSCIREMIVTKFGYRAVQAHMFSDSQEGRREAVERLQKFYDLKELQSCMRG